LTRTSADLSQAVYSNVSVYEMEVNGVAVMRRRSDSWLNATQILKVAGVDKGKRTKVLEKEILNGEHEKVQGGYGKYQGTWINYNRGVEFCRQFGVEELLRPLLQYDVSNDGSVGLETPTKEQALAAQRRRLYGSDNNMPQSGTYFKNMSNTAASAIPALNRTRLDSPNHIEGRRSVGPRRPSQYGQDQYQSSQQSLHSIASQDSFSNGAMMSHGASFADFPNTDAQEPPRKRIRPSPNTSFAGFDGPMDLHMQDGTPTEPTQSFFSQHSQSFMMPQPVPYSLEPLPQPRGPAEQQKQEWLMSLFMEPAKTDFEDDAAFLRLSGEEFEMPIDAKGNTALHWAATLARIPLVKKLLDRGFNMRRGNSGGETALVAACQARNNLDQSTFNQLLDLLGPSIEVRDGRGRTLLHHIAVSSAMKGRAAVGRYYLESLLEYTVRQGSSLHSSMNGSQPEVAPMTLARFMNEIVNAQDKAGDTALNLAARTSTTTIIDQLIEVGADPTVANRGGLAPVDFGVASGANGVTQHQSSFNAFDMAIAENESSQKSFEEAGENFVNCE
jgi:regulatory protein SWI6